VGAYQPARDISFVWVPAHCGLLGNELADKAANKAGKLSQSETPISLPSARATIRRCRRIQDDTFYGEYATYARPSKREKNMTRWEEVTVNQFRTGASPRCAATHHAMNRADSPNCLDCGELDTGTHVLAHCPMGAQARWEIGGPEASEEYFLKNSRALLTLLRRTGRGHIGAIAPEAS
jgi:hypothetical protein